MEKYYQADARLQNLSNILYI